jgi:hypothetical protein
VAPIGEGADRLEIPRRHGPRDVDFDGFPAADQMPFRLAVAPVQEDALVLAQVLLNNTATSNFLERQTTTENRHDS